jgi:hypothetical protein
MSPRTAPKAAPERLSEPATDPETTTPEPEPLPDTREHRAFRAANEFITEIGYDPAAVTSITLDANGVRVFYRHKTGRNNAQMIRFREIPFEDRQRILVEIANDEKENA